MATSKNHLFESGALGGDWADETVQHAAPEPKPAGSVWGAKPQQKKEEPVDFSKIQAEEKQTKAKQHTEPPARGPAGRREEGDYQRRDEYNTGVYRPPRSDYAPRDYGRPEGGYRHRDEGGYRPRDDNYNEGGYRPRDYAPRDFGRPRDEGGYRPRDEGGYRPRDDNYRRDYGKPRDEGRPREPLLTCLPEDMILQPPFVVRLGNLNYNMDESFLEEYFKELGIVRVTIVRDEMTNKSKGFGFIEFESPTGVDCALRCNNSEELLMDREFEVRIHQKKEVERAPRYGFGPAPGEQSRSFGPSRTFDRPSGPPKVDLKPRTVDVDTKPRDPSPKKKPLSEDPFGGAALDSEKMKLRQQKEAEREERQKAEHEKIRADRERELHEKQAKQEEERKKREESWRLEKQAKDQKAQEEADKKRKEKEDTGPDNWRSNPNKWSNNKGPGNKKEESPKKYGGGIGRGQDSGFKGQRGGDFKGRGGKPGDKPGRGDGFRGQGKNEGKGPNKPKETPAEQDPEGFVAAKETAKPAPASYKAALGAQEKTATVNPFAALQKDQEAPEEGDQ